MKYDREALAEKLKPKKKDISNDSKSKFDDVEGKLARYEKHSKNKVTSPGKPRIKSIPVPLSLPENEFDKFEETIEKAFLNKIRITRTDIIRMGISLIFKMPHKEIKGCLESIEKRMPGKPKG